MAGREGLAGQTPRAAAASSFWDLSGNSLLIQSIAGFDPGCVKSHESVTIPPFPDGGYGWDASLKARTDP
ncbi:hypothetical protein, partial [Bradyrhizobium sp. MOS001]|uniref:hypothetical protein n=1 Tax=Bradyrhizobium sp. MOS001 TaxID=2133948 RepID=UPI00195F41A5